MPVNINSDEKVAIELTINQLSYIELAIQDSIALCNEKRRKSNSEIFKKAQMCIIDIYSEIKECIDIGMESQNGKNYE